MGFFYYYLFYFNETIWKKKIVLVLKKKITLCLLLQPLCKHTIGKQHSLSWHRSLKMLSSPQKDFSIQIRGGNYQAPSSQYYHHRMTFWMHFQLRITLTSLTNKRWEWFLYSELVTMKAQDKSPASLRIIKITCFQI